MAKKQSKQSTKRKRSGSIERCLADAQDFLMSTKQKKIVKTRTMLKTIQEGKQHLAKKGTGSASKHTPKHTAKHIGKLTIKLTSKDPKKTIKARANSNRGKCRSHAAVISARVSCVAPPPSTAATMIRARGIDDITRPSKATIFKTKSNQALPQSAFGFIDICFCVDSTGSMGSELAQVQSTVVAIIERIQNKVRTQGVTLRFAVVAYRDHGDTHVVQHQDFTDALDTVDYVRKLTAYGGGDEPEAAHDGLLEACTALNWVEVPGTPMLRYVFHVLDAPPHGKQFGNPQPSEGCTCGKTTEEVVHELNVKQIHYRMIKVRKNPRVDTAQILLRSRLTNFDSADIGSASQMDIRVSDMIIHEIMPA